MNPSIIFSEHEIKAIHKARDLFIVSKLKYNIFKYINVPDKQHPLKLVLCEALFRNIILELYSIFFDTNDKTIAKIITKKLTELVKLHKGAFEFKWSIPYYNSLEVEQFQKAIKISIDNEQKDENIINLNVESVRDKLKKYRHNVLAHKASKDSNYDVSHTDLEMLLIEAEKIVSTLLILVEGPSTAYVFSIEHIANDHSINNLFSVLANKRETISVISHFFGMVVYMFYNKHNPPHFQVRYGKQQAIININTSEVIEGSLSNMAIELVTNWAKLYKQELLEDWELAQKHQPLKTIAPLE